LYKRIENFTKKWFLIAIKFLIYYSIFCIGVIYEQLY
jgi:hypothetical protein